MTSKGGGAVVQQKARVSVARCVGLSERDFAFQFRSLSGMRRRRDRPDARRALFPLSVHLAQSECKRFGRGTAGGAAVGRCGRRTRARPSPRFGHSGVGYIGRRRRWWWWEYRVRLRPSLRADDSRSSSATVAIRTGRRRTSPHSSTIIMDAVDLT